MNKPDYPSLANEIDKPRPDMKKFAAITITKICYTTLIMYKSFAFFPVFVLFLVCKHITNGKRVIVEILLYFYISCKRFTEFKFGHFEI